MKGLYKKGKILNERSWSSGAPPIIKKFFMKTGADFQNKIARVFLIVVCFSIVFMIFNFTALAQWSYLNYYYPLSINSPFSQNLNPYDWQNVNPLTINSYYGIYQSNQVNQPYQLLTYNQLTSQYSANYSYNNYSLMNYNVNNFTNYQYITPFNSSTYQSPSLTYYYNSYNNTRYPFNNSFVPGYNSLMPSSNVPVPQQSMVYFPNQSPIYLPQLISPQVEKSEYIAVVPGVLHIGEVETVSLSFIHGEGLTRNKLMGRVQVALSQGGETVLEAENYIVDKGTIDFIVPEVEAGEYEIRIKGEDFEDKATVNVVEDLLVFLQTDKPIYQPDQTIHMRVITLNSALKPESKEVIIEVQDAKGIKIFRKQALTDEYGMVVIDLPISREPNLGVWKITTSSGQASTQVDVRVEKYVLPKYEVKVELPKEWFLVDEPIVGKVKAEYSFGKPVRGDLVIEASKYVGEWKLYETFSKEIDGEAEFEISPVGYVTGVPGSGGMGNCTLDIKVKERNTGYEEKTNKLITITNSSLILQIIPEGSVFKPSLPFNALIVSKTPDNKPSEVNVNTKVTYIDKDLNQMGIMDEALATSSGKALLTFTPPEGCVALTIDAVAATQGVQVSKALQSGYSPSGNFIHVEQISQGIPRVGEEIGFKVYATNEAVNFYYEVISRDKVIFSDVSGSSEISFVVTPMMSPQAKFLVYQILPNSEVAADYLPFDVKADYPLQVNARFDKDEVKPGEDVQIMIETEGKAKVGLVAVDKSVFILAENRLNLQQVFDEIERLYMEPQVELDSYSVYSKVTTKGAKEIFKDAGVIVLSNKNIPEGQEYQNPQSEWGWGWGWRVGLDEFFGAVPMPNVFMAANDMGVDKTLSLPETEGLAQVEKIRQFFPETWIWQEVITSEQGEASVSATAPDTITTWNLQAVAISQEKGLGIGEDELKVFQPFFVTIDLPYSAIRGEEFPVRVSVYNYLDANQNVLVEIKENEWFYLLDSSYKTVTVGANDIGGTQFKIKPAQLGIKEIEVTARSSSAADAIIKTIVIVPEGVERDCVENFVLHGGDSRVFTTALPGDIVPDSGRSYIAATSSFLAQTIEGLDELLKMPYGCGEQNMINLAPDIYITQYLKETGQIKPEIMAKAEKLRITGYQRELTYRRNDGSFSAFGENDQEGSLWLTAFVLKVFSQAKGVMYIDENILSQAKNWLTGHQNADGSFDPVGFLHHQDMMGGLKGKTALTAFTVIALKEAGDLNSSAKASAYLESQLNTIQDAYTMAIAAYALELSGSAKRDEAYGKLMKFSKEDEDGLYWDAGGAAIEATAYAALALIKHVDIINAGQAARWLVTQRNSSGGFRSTQDTVIALEALTAFSERMTADVDLTVELKIGEEILKKIDIGPENFDVLQIVEAPINKDIQISAQGKGDVVIQGVKRFNLPNPQKEGQSFDIKVDYDTTEVEVNDLVNVLVEVTFTPSLPIQAGMVVLDISVPTGFTPVIDTLESLLKAEAKIKRYDVAGRKVIFFIEDMLPSDVIAFSFKVKALYPVKAKGTTSQAYSYYNPEMKGETLSKEMTVLEQ